MKYMQDIAQATVNGAPRGSKLDSIQQVHTLGIPGNGSLDVFRFLLQRLGMGQITLSQLLSQRRMVRVSVPSRIKNVYQLRNTTVLCRSKMCFSSELWRVLGDVPLTVMFAGAAAASAAASDAATVSPFACKRL